MKLIQVLGGGCRRCQRLNEQLKKNAETAVVELGIPARVECVSDITALIHFNVLATPALVVDGEVKAVGRVPTSEEIKGFLT